MSEMMVMMFLFELMMMQEEALYEVPAAQDNAKDPHSCILDLVLRQDELEQISAYKYLTNFKPKHSMTILC